MCEDSLEAAVLIPCPFTVKSQELGHCAKLGV